MEPPWGQLLCYKWTGVWLMQVKLTKISYIGTLLYPRSTGGGYTVLPLAVLPSVQDIFRCIFLSNY